MIRIRDDWRPNRSVRPERLGCNVTHISSRFRQGLREQVIANVSKWKIQSVIGNEVLYFYINMNNDMYRSDVTIETGAFTVMARPKKIIAPVAVSEPVKVPARRGRPPKVETLARQAQAKPVGRPPKAKAVGRPAKAKATAPAAVAKPIGRPPKAAGRPAVAAADPLRVLKAEMKQKLDEMKVELLATKSELKESQKREAALFKLIEAKEKAVSSFSSKWQADALKKMGRKPTPKAAGKVAGKRGRKRNAAVAKEMAAGGASAAAA